MLGKVTGVTNFVDGLYSISQKEYKKMATNFAVGSLKVATWVVIANVALNTYERFSETPAESCARTIANTCYNNWVRDSGTVYFPGREIELKKSFDTCVQVAWSHCGGEGFKTAFKLSELDYSKLLNYTYSFYNP